MAVCGWCNQEMSISETISCTGNETVKFPNGEELGAIRFFPSDLSEERKDQIRRAHPEIIDRGLYSPSSGNRCHDCNVYIGGFHHPGCDNERCPKCGAQLISCGCLEEEE